MSHHEEIEVLREICKLLRRILSFLLGENIPAESIGQIQIDTGENMPTNFSVQAGGTAVVQMTPLPTNSVFQPTTPTPTFSFTPSDPNVQVVPHVAGVGGVPADTTGTIFDVSVPATDTSTTFTLGVSGPDGAAGATISGTQVWSIVAPPPTPATAIGQVQLA